MNAFPDKYLFDSNRQSKFVRQKYIVYVDQMMMNENLFTYTPTLLHSFIQINRISLSLSLSFGNLLFRFSLRLTTLICKCPIKEHSMHVVVDEISCFT